MSGAYYNEVDQKAAAWLKELVRRGLIAPGDVDDRSILEVKASEVRGYTQCHWMAGIGVWAAALAPVMAGIERAAVQTAVQLTQYSQCIRDAVNTYKPFRRERERYLRRRRQTRATFHGK